MLLLYGARDHRRTGVESQHAALGERAFLRVVVLAAPVRSALLRLRREGWHAPVRGIDHQRGLLGDPLAEVPPEVVVRALHIRGGAAAAIVLVPGLDPLLREFLSLLVAQRAFSRKRAGTFERRELGKVPCALEVRVAVGRARYLRRCLGGDGNGGDQEDAEENGTHTAAPFVVRAIIIAAGGRNENRGRRDRRKRAYGRRGFGSATAKPGDVHEGRGADLPEVVPELSPARFDRADVPSDLRGRAS